MSNTINLFENLLLMNESIETPKNKKSIKRNLKESSMELDWYYEDNFNTIEDSIEHAREFAPSLKFDIIDDSTVKITGDRRAIERYLYIYMGCDDDDEVEFFMDNYLEESKKLTKRNLKESQEDEQNTTVLNLAVELPIDKNISDIQPNDVNVNVGVIPIDNSDADDSDDYENDNSENDLELNDDSENFESNDTPTNAEESLRRIKESNDDYDDDEHFIYDKPNANKIIKFVKSFFNKRQIEYDKGESGWHYEEGTGVDATGYFFWANDGWVMIDIYNYMYPADEIDTFNIYIHDDEVVENYNPNELYKALSTFIKDMPNWEIIEDFASDTEESLRRIKTESKLDDNSLNKLVTAFLKEDYKNIKSVKFIKANTVGSTLRLEAVLRFNNNKCEKFIIENKGFNSKKLEGKTFEMDFKEITNAFKIVKESTKTPFKFKAYVKEGVLYFDTFQYNYKVKLQEGKLAEVSGKFGLRKPKIKSNKLEKIDFNYENTSYISGKLIELWDEGILTKDEVIELHDIIGIDSDPAETHMTENKPKIKSNKN